MRVVQLSVVSPDDNFNGLSTSYPLSLTNTGMVFDIMNHP